MKWKSLRFIGYSNYSVNEYGDVYDKKKDKFVIANASHRYLRVSLVKDKVGRMWYVHRLVALSFVAGQMTGKVVDHIDRNKLNNHRSNLRWVTDAENAKNRNPPEFQFQQHTVNKSNCSSKYRGVHWCKKSESWRVQCRVEKKLYTIGAFDDQVEAALAYNEFVKEKYGDKAKLNIIED